MIEYPRFPEIEPLAVHHLKVSDVHTLYIEEVGNPDGLPVIYLHGGPGAGIQPKNRCFFDPQLFHVYLFGQRGSLPSSPAGEIRENTTQLLIEDIESIRNHFGVPSWIVFGGSWGSTLALAYALEHPQAVTALVLRGIFLGNQHQMDWLYTDIGAANFYPKEWQRFIEFLPEPERGDLLSAYARRIFDPNPAVHLPAARAWVEWEGGLMFLIPGDPPPMTDEEILSSARVECHYMINDLFFPENDFLLKNAHRLQAIPCHIVQGRYDMICPPEAAFALAAEMPQAVLHTVPDAGHSSSAPEMTSELIRAMLDVAQTLKK
jgi:proline iminopeptidase